MIWSTEYFSWHWPNIILRSSLYCKFSNDFFCPIQSVNVFVVGAPDLEPRRWVSPFSTKALLIFHCMNPHSAAQAEESIVHLFFFVSDSSGMKTQRGRWRTTDCSKCFFHLSPFILYFINVREQKYFFLPLIFSFSAPGLLSMTEMKRFV